MSKITLPASVTSIGDSAFEDCQYLKEITLQEGIESIGDAAFRNCGMLSGVTLPASLTSLGDSVFEDCFSYSYVEKMTIPAGVTRIGDSAFSGCTYLLAITFLGSVESIGNSAFHDCQRLREITLPASVKSIGESAFQDCKCLEEITLQDGIESIGASAFHDCQQLRDVTLPASVKSIGESAFQGCSQLTKMTIPAGVTSISDSVFSGCSALKKITLPAGVTSIGASAFSGCGLTSIEIPAGVTSIGEWAFSSCKLKSVEIPAGVTSIKDSVFRQCGSLTSVTIPASVTEIGESAFYNCQSLTSVTIPTSVTEIRDNAFNNCKGLTSVTIPAGVTEIGQMAFFNCKGLKSVTIPASVTDIRWKAFGDCDCIEDVYYAGSETDWKRIKIDGSNTSLTNATKHFTPQLDAPTADPGSGSLEKGTSVSLSCTTADARIYYTLDKTKPTEDSTLYSVPIVINETTQIKAIAVMDGYLSSPVAVFNYSIKEETVEYTVKFMADGKEHDSKTAVEGTKVTEPTVPTKEGYEFLGWYDGDTLYDFDSPVTADLTLTAKWKEKEDSGDEPGGNTEDEPGGNTEDEPGGNIEDEPGGNIEDEPGSNTEDEPGGTQEEKPAEKPEEKPVEFTVTFTVDGTEYASKKVAKDAKAEEPTAPTKDGYEFLGWYDGETKYDFTKPVTADLKLTDKWKEKETTPAENPEDEVTWEKTDVLIKGSGKQQLSIDGTKYPGKVTWKTSDKKVATVTKKGKVTAKGGGVATITAYVDGKAVEEYKVRVYQFTKLTFGNNKTSFKDTYTNTDDVFDEKDLVTVTINVGQKNAWAKAEALMKDQKLDTPAAKSGKAKVAEVKSVALKGDTITLTVQPKKKGSAKITVKFGGKTAAYTLKVK